MGSAGLRNRFGQFGRCAERKRGKGYAKGIFWYFLLLVTKSTSGTYRQEICSANYNAGRVEHRHSCARRRSDQRREQLLLMSVQCQTSARLWLFFLFGDKKNQKAPLA